MRTNSEFTEAYTGKPGMSRSGRETLTRGSAPRSDEVEFSAKYSFLSKVPVTLIPLVVPLTDPP